MKDSGEPSWNPDIYELAHSITGAYFAAVPQPALSADDRDALWHALVVRIAGLIIAGQTPAQVGSQVNGTIEEWEREHRAGPGPHHFIVKSPGEVTVKG